MSEGNGYHKPLYVTLECGCENEVQVVAVDESGNKLNHGVIAILSLRGIYRCGGLNECLGFTQDEKRRILDISWEGIR